MATSRGSLHHLELWVADLDAGVASWGWLLEQLGYTVDGRWDRGASWRLHDAYVVVESGPDVLPEAHERRRPGVNHVAFHAGSHAEVDTLVAASADHGWTLLFPERHPYAGGPQHYAAYLEDPQGHEVELVADDA